MDRIPSGVQPKQDECMRHLLGGFGDFAPYPVGWDTTILGVKDTTDPFIMGDVDFAKPAGGRDWPIFGGGGLWDDPLLDGGSGGVIGGG